MKNIRAWKSLEKSLVAARKRDRRIPCGACGSDETICARCGWMKDEGASCVNCAEIETACGGCADRLENGGGESWLQSLLFVLCVLTLIAAAYFGC